MFNFTLDVCAEKKIHKMKIIVPAAVRAPPFDTQIHVNVWESMGKPLQLCAVYKKLYRIAGNFRWCKFSHK